MNRIARASLMCVVIIVAAGAVHGETVVQGTITTTTWSKVNSPYRVTGAITVPANDMLTIEPGVDVRFAQNTSMRVYGGLVASGTESDSVRFVADSTSWAGIMATRFAVMSHARISGATGWALVASCSSAMLTDCVFRGNTGFAVINASAGRTTLTRCLIAGNTLGTPWDAVYAGSAVVTMENCTIAGNVVANSIHAEPVTQIQAVGCIIRDNGATAVYVGGPPTTGDIRMRYSNVRGGYPGAGNIDIDPQFADNLAFSLAPGSPCVDVGSPYFLDADSSRSDMGHTGSGGPNPDFPRVEAASARLIVGATAVSSLAIRNTGWHELAVSALALPPGFASTTMFPLTIAPGDTAEVPITFAGTTVDSGDAVVSHTDIWESDIAVRLVGVPGTAVAGAISGTWATSASPIRVVAEVWVSAGDSLAIEPGVTVLFDADVPIVVYGRLAALGTEADSIRFLPGTAPRWKGVALVDADPCTLAYARIGGADARGRARPMDPYGGGLLVHQGRAGMAHVVLSGNAAYRGAGAEVRTVDDGAVASLTLHECIFAGNTGDAVSSNGPGASLRMEGCTVRGTDGRGVYVYGGDATIDSCLIHGNTSASTTGAGIYAGSAHLSLRRTIIANNAFKPTPSLTKGGALYATRSAIAVDHCTMAGNGAKAGSNMYFDTQVTGVVTNSIAWRATGSSETYGVSGGDWTIEWSDIATAGDVNFLGMGVINADPLFGNPADLDYTYPSYFCPIFKG